MNSLIKGSIPDSHLHPSRGAASGRRRVARRDDDQLWPVKSHGAVLLSSACAADGGGQSTGEPCALRELRACALERFARGVRLAERLEGVGREPRLTEPALPVGDR